MPSITMSRHEAKYLAARALTAAGYTCEQIGFAMLTLEDEDRGPEIETLTEPEYTEPEPFEPSEEDWASYELWLERLETEHGMKAWTIQPVR